jgi:hypothetical protein
MDTMDIVSLIASGISFIGILFIVYNYFKNPQIKNEEEHIRTEEQIKDKASLLSQKEVENKAGVLEKQFDWYMKANDQKFADMGKRLDDAFLLAANHTNTVDTKVTELVKSVNIMGNEITKLSTIIEERIPRK